RNVLTTFYGILQLPNNCKLIINKVNPNDNYSYLVNQNNIYLIFNYEDYIIYYSYNNKTEIYKINIQRINIYNYGLLSVNNIYVSILNNNDINIISIELTVKVFKKIILRYYDYKFERMGNNLFLYNKTNVVCINTKFKNMMNITNINITNIHDLSLINLSDKKISTRLINVYSLYIDDINNLSIDDKVSIIYDYLTKSNDSFKVKRNTNVDNVNIFKLLKLIVSNVFIISILILICIFIKRK